MEGEDPRSATDWRAFQAEVAALFTQTHGWSARADHAVRGARIGVVHVDVLATYRPPRRGEGCRVDQGDHSPRPPTDPDVGTSALGSSNHRLATGR